jgi:hypothetical protein
LIINQEDNPSSSDFSGLIVVWYLYLLAGISLIILSFFWLSDLPPTPQEDIFASLAGLQETQEKLPADSLQNIFQDEPMSRRSSVSSVSSGTDARRKMRSEKLSASIIDKGDSDSERRATQTKRITVNLKDNMDNLSKIDVIKFEEIMRDNKKTTVFVIEYWINGIQLSTKRSFSEFAQFYKDLKKQHPKLEFEEFPSKEILKSNDAETHASRLRWFDAFLKFCLGNRVHAETLATFLASPENLRVYGKDKLTSHEELSPSTPEVDTKIFRDPRKKTSGMIQDYANEDSKRESMDGARRSSGGGGHYFKVDITALKQGKAYFYTMDIRDDIGTSYVVTKRYSEFKAFHEKLKKAFGSKILDGINLPEKGNLGIFTSEDAKLIEYRKNGLKSYMQLLMNNQVIRSHKVIEEFLTQDFPA